MSITCPHCKKRIEGAIYRYEKGGEAVRRVLMRADAGGPRGVHVRLLAETYAYVMKQHGRQISKLAARRAIERLAKDGLLRAMGEGYYRVAPKASHYARDRR